MGLAFKPDIDDLRESPAVHVANALKNESGMDVLFVEPNIQTHPGFEITLQETALNRADLVIFLVRHKPFVGMETEKPILDFCGVEQ